MTTVTSEELWETVDVSQQEVDDLREQVEVGQVEPTALQEPAKKLGKALATIHALAREGW